jgi:hypothetical protein
MSRPAGTRQVRGTQDRCVSIHCASLAASDPARQRQTRDRQGSSCGLTTIFTMCSLSLRFKRAQARVQLIARGAQFSEHIVRVTFSARQMSGMISASCGEAEFSALESTTQCLQLHSLCNVKRDLIVADCVAAYAPPTVSQTKVAFLQAYDKPINALYEPVIQELLVQQHFMRYNIKYKYDPVRPPIA